MICIILPQKAFFI